VNLLLRDGFLDYNMLKVFDKSLFQHEYKIIKEAFQYGIPKEYIVQLFAMRDEILRNPEDAIKILQSLSHDLPQKSVIQCEFFKSACDKPDPADLDKACKNLMIFDDLLLEKQNTCWNYYVRRRYSNVDCFYLAQNYFKLPRQTIRENANFICLFPQELKNINHIYNDHVSTNLSKDEFWSLQASMVSSAWVCNN
jgi:hypothetical protein